ncbi:MAG: hypothetical protein AVDCRST_MAG78-856 [uncultured Rubrobacteraceae bacterium]|uniref:Uncharacterized protein n=1 Tax=uncultured Rubrobacteraceae bacterium TaxID=349277 RepID=A0A6J4PKE6_9ACTN|nr:MAG: hypothetical protein AVDCRST_MAG78-856 [uncultured Rubrobacteraceae bacterium]
MGILLFFQALFFFALQPISHTLKRIWSTTP